MGPNNRASDCSNPFLSSCHNKTSRIVVVARGAFMSQPGAYVNQILLESILLVTVTIASADAEVTLKQSVLIP